MVVGWRLRRLGFVKGKRVNNKLNQFPLLNQEIKKASIIYSWSTNHVGTLATIESLKNPCIAGFMKHINSTPQPTSPLHHRSPPPTSSSMIVTPSTPNPQPPNPSTIVCRHYCKP
nr:hypothetical protein [Tanacetum cinerariifolium]